MERRIKHNYNNHFHFVEINKNLLLNPALGDFSGHNLYIMAQLQCCATGQCCLIA